MKKIILVKKHAVHKLLAACCTVILSSILYVSCGDIYDNIKEFSVEEIVYPAHFDTIHGKVGYERVEIDLSQYGRIPSSQMNLGKAKGTLIEYDDKVITFDSVCSWVNITGLTQSKLYRFKVYTIDEHKNRSTPKEIALTPYTADDESALALPSPLFIESTTMALVEWRNSVSNELFDFLSYEYSYKDKNGNTKSGSGVGDLPSFFIEDVEWGKVVQVTMVNKVLPKLLNRPIMDTVTWTYQLEFAVEGSQKAIFLDLPAGGVTLGVNTFPHTFIWKRGEGINDYSLMLSTQSTFPEGATTTIHVGNTDRYEVQREEVVEVLKSSVYSKAPFFWKVIPADNNPDVITQARQFTVQREQKNEYWITLNYNEEFRWITYEILDNESSWYIQTNGNNANPNDPRCHTANFTEDIKEKAMVLNFDYRCNRELLFELFFKAPAADGAKMTTFTLMETGEWTPFSMEIGGYAQRFAWGTAGHSFRLDPGQNWGTQLYIRNFRITAYDE
ncbi:MAG: DUF4998 domain-containing protein [Prevotellaceae bacterium]|nr:DUF4998 domain-containing protein [Prevotellaceae bacterium]